MLKHVQHHSSSSVTSAHNTTRRGVSPAPSSTSISTLGSAGSSSSSTCCSSPSSVTSSESSNSSITSTCCQLHESSNNSSPSSWRELSECRTLSRLSMLENPNAVPLRVYAACLRPDIQYKTIGVTSCTTCEDVISAILNKCKVRFKDPRLFELVMEVCIRGPNGTDTRASIKLEDRAIPLQLHDCYPKGQAKFILQMKTGSLVKIFDGSNTVGWQYKSIMISNETTAGELVDILFRYTTKDLDEIHFYSLQIETKEWKRALSWNEAIVPAKLVAARFTSAGEPKLVLKASHSSSPSTSLLRRVSTLSLYENVQSSHHFPQINYHPFNTIGPTKKSSNNKNMNKNPVELMSKVLTRKQRSKSFSESPTPESDVSSSSLGSSGTGNNFSPNRLTVTTVDIPRTPRLSTVSINTTPRPHYQNIHNSITESVISSFNKLKTSRYGKYELSEAFFV